jgi:predicted TIM-barrel fold metal-dependent hydrolase
MPETTHRLYSCDDHLDIYNVPRDLWVRRLPVRLRDAGPHVVERDGLHWWVVGDRTLGISGNFAGVATERGTEPDDGFRASNPKLRLADMELDGIHASIVYGPGALTGFPIPDAELKRAVIRAWNDWSAEEFNSHAPDRLSALAALPTTSPGDAILELQRCARLGHRGVLFNAHDVAPFTDLGDPVWDRFWAAAAEAGLPVSFHIGGGSVIGLAEGATWERDGWKIAAYGAVIPIQLDEPLVMMVFSGVLERHSGLRLVLAEAGVGWLPYFLHRMDHTFELHCRQREGQIRTRPSELFRRQVWATFEEEPLAAQLIPLLGADRVMWACDYPHPDSTWPHSRKAIDESLGALGAGAVRQITAENCRELYRFD